MKREARQHGMVRTYPVLLSPWNPKSKSRSIQRLDSLPFAGLFSSVSSKPSNHSKFTGKCGRPQCLGCHLNPVSKSKDKTKGTRKLRTSNMVVSPRLITWRVVDRRPGLKFSGFSATGILEHLYSGIEQDEIDDHVNDHDDDYDNGGTCALVDGDDNDFMANFWSLHEKEIEEYVDDEDKIDSDDNDFMAIFWSLHEKEIEEYVDDEDKIDSDDNDFMAIFWSLHEKEIEEYVDDEEKIDSNDNDDDDDDAMSICDVGFMIDQNEEDEGWCLLRET
ncbi:prostatic spermine-binding protein-like [Durio zibethinus]|uniref:Prostatic spermine-binding protein-like n=1 Tax=Durio zibethinus TaxID=66656 RepID=A0A6P6BB47_DURZI|nr:prostatic spermine-binding protein-like [Durio zibethinus]